MLFYCKCDPLQEVMGVLFGLSQPQVCLWIGRLTPLVVNAALGRELVRPARRPADLAKLLEEVYLGPTSAGSVHDKTLADESGLALPADAVVLQDTGFQGYAVAGAQTYQPRKKPRGRELPAYVLAINKVSSKARGGVEHAISKVKRCRLVADTWRNLRSGFVDQAMEVACGLHSLRVSARA